MGQSGKSDKKAAKEQRKADERAIEIADISRKMLVAALAAALGDPQVKGDADALAGYLLDWLTDPSKFQTVDSLDDLYGQAIITAQERRATTAGGA